MTTFLWFFYLFSFKWPKKPNGILEKLEVKKRIRSLNITFLDKFFIELPQGVLYKHVLEFTTSLFLHKKSNRSKEVHLKK